MNKLDREARARILHLLCEGNSIRAVTRLTGASKKAVSKLLVDAGQAAAWYQDRVFRNLTCKRIQVDEIWAFVYAKQKNVATAKADRPMLATYGLGPRSMPIRSSFPLGSWAAGTAKRQLSSWTTFDRASQTASN
jgi:hypothetical protein